LRLGDTFHIYCVGFTILNSRQFDAPVARFVVQILQGDLKSDGHPTGEPLEVSGLDLLALYQKRNAIADPKDVMTALLAQATQQAADALLVVEPYDWRQTRIPPLPAALLDRLLREAVSFL
jgi:hypothetical protein